MFLQKILVGIYAHPENYPPTLNAIAELAKYASQIQIVHRPHRQTDWEYPPEVELHPSGREISPPQQERASIFWKIVWFVAFTWKLGLLLYRNKPNCVLIYDDLALLSITILCKLGLLPSNSILWYHNHDVYDVTFVKKYSLTWWAIKAEKWIFPKLSIFSLPALDRKQFFPIQQFTGQFFFLPNFPAVKIYHPYFVANKPLNEIRVLFQGQLGEGHGIEELLAMMPFSVNDKAVKLILRGHARNGYDLWLKEQIELRKLEKHVEYHGFTPYKNIPKLGAQCHIGLAIFKKQDVMNRTIGTASNKIYEYAALGLPILYFDSAYFREYLGKYSWAKATDLSAQSIQKSLTEISLSYTQLSIKAHHDFMDNLNFEFHFSKVLNYLNQQKTF